MKNHMTLVQANATIERADSLFNRAARAWERGNNSGNEQGMTRGNAQCARFRDAAEALLTPLGVSVDYPGLFPSFTVRGFCYHTTESAVSAALESRADEIRAALARLEEGVRQWMTKPVEPADMERARAALEVVK